MSSTDLLQPHPAEVDDELGLLIKEARARQRRRWAVVSILLVAGIAACAEFGLGGGRSAPRSHATPRRPAIKFETVRQTAGAATLSNVNSVDFVNADTGWVLTNDSTRLLATVDAGRHWTGISPPVLRRSGWIVDGTFTRSRTDLWVGVSKNVAEQTDVELLNSTNDGKSWTDRGVFPRGGGYVWPYFVSQSRGWLMVDNGAASGSDWVTIYTTASAGKHWTLLARPTFPTDTAETGTPDAPSSGCDKEGITFASSNSGWIGEYCNGGPVTLQRSVDGGRKWQLTRLNTNEQGGFADAPSFFNAADGVSAAGGISSTTGTVIFTTTNGGRNWKQHEVPASNGGPVDALSPTTWFVSSGQTIYQTTNAGVTWASRRSPTASNAIGRGDLDFVNLDDGWVVTASGSLWHTTNGGRSWTRS